MTHKQCFCTKCQTSWIGTVDYCPNCGNKEVYVGIVSTTEFPELATKLATSCKNLATKQGRWIKNDGRYGWHCSVCGEDDRYAFAWNSDTGENELQDHYCPHCGAKME